MNDNVRELISAVVDNDIQKAKKCAQAIVGNDKTQKNKNFCEMIKRKLQSSSMNLLELPYNVQGILKMEDVSMSFNENRYYLSERESKIYTEIDNMYQTSLKLSEMGIHYLNSIILHGESGTGKTLFGRYIAYKLGLPFIYMNISNIIESYLGNTSKNISRSFDFIQKQKCVFMIDEIDTIGTMRNKKDVGEMARITISLMQALDCIRNDVIIISATNRIDMIDKALLRRFAIKHEVTKFSDEELESMIIRFLKDTNITYQPSNIKEYCTKAQPFQANAINEVVRSIAKSIRTCKPFEMCISNDIGGDQ
jgi:SpoVK/Ycf46/Vps4 family AAA+-type ATPase